jgi:hypothetical protein
MSGPSAAVRDEPKSLSSVRSRSGLAGMNSYPADERRISEVERGLSWNAVLPLPAEKTLAPGDSIIFALASSDANGEPCYVSGGDSVRVVLTEVIDLGSNDPATGRALCRLSWAPPGQDMPGAIPTRKRPR